MSYYPYYNRKKHYSYDEYDEYDEFDEYCDYEYDDYYEYDKDKKCDGYYKFDKCSCFEEMRKLLKGLENKNVVIITKNMNNYNDYNEYWGTIECVKGWLLHFHIEDDFGKNVKREKGYGRSGNTTIPITQIAAVGGFTIECSCIGSYHCRIPIRKECCCGEDQLGRFIKNKKGSFGIAIISGQVLENLIVYEVTNQLAIFRCEDRGLSGPEYRGMYIAVPLCCITEVMDQSGGFGLKNINIEEKKAEVTEETK